MEINNNSKTVIKEMVDKELELMKELLNKLGRVLGVKKEKLTNEELGNLVVSDIKKYYGYDVKTQVVFSGLPSTVLLATQVENDEDVVYINAFYFGRKLSMKEIKGIIAAQGRYLWLKKQGLARECIVTKWYQLFGNTLQLDAIRASKNFTKGKFDKLTKETIYSKRLRKEMNK